MEYFNDTIRITYDTMIENLKEMSITTENSNIENQKSLLLAINILEELKTTIEEWHHDKTGMVSAKAYFSRLIEQYVNNWTNSDLYMEWIPVRDVYFNLVAKEPSWTCSKCGKLVFEKFDTCPSCERISKEKIVATT